jgi:hypothetical protein
MDTTEQHRKNAALEKRFMTEARNDENYLHAAAQREASQGHIVESRFLAQEARFAGSWLGKRERILKHEEKMER